MEFWTDLLFSPPIIIAALVIGTFGEVMKRIVLGSNKSRSKVRKVKTTAAEASAAEANPTKENGGHVDPAAPRVVVQWAVPRAMWRKVYFVTLPAHPVIVGTLLGFIPFLPPAEQLSKPGYELAARVGTYCLAGVVCKIGYDTMVSTVLRAIQARGVAVAGAVGGSAADSNESGEEPSEVEPGIKADDSEDTDS